MLGEVHIVGVDKYGTEKQVQIEVTGADESVLMVLAANIRAAWDSASNLGAKRSYLLIPFGAANAASDPSNVDVGCTIRGVSAVDGKTVILRVADPLAACINADRTIDLNNATLKDYLDFFITSGGALLSDGESVSSWTWGVLDKK
jgi:hypothetical protein